RPRPPGVHGQTSEAAWRSQRRAALIELTPDEALRPNEHGNFSGNLGGTLNYNPAGGLQAHSLPDFSGNALIKQPRDFHPEIKVVSGADTPQPDEITEEFLTRNLRTPLVVPGCDGTAAWDDS